METEEKPDIKDLDELNRLVARFKSTHDNESFEKIYLRFKDSLYGYFMTHTGDPYLSEDLMQDTFVAVAKNIDNLKAVEAFTTYINTTAHNKLVDYLRSKKPDEESLEQTDDDTEQPLEEKFADDRVSSRPEEQYIDNETKEVLMSVINSLSEQKKMTTILFYRDDMKISEIAELMSCSEGTVKSRLNSARADMKNKVDELEKKGITLRCTGAALFLWLILQMEKENAAKLHNSSAVAESKAAADEILKKAGDTAVGEVLKKAPKKLFNIGKLAVTPGILAAAGGVAAAAVAAAIIIIANVNKNPETQETTVQIAEEEMTTEPAAVTDVQTDVAVTDAEPTENSDNFKDYDYTYTELLTYDSLQYSYYNGHCFAVYSQDDKYGLLTDGTETLECSYDVINVYELANNSYFTFKLDGKSGICDDDGVKILDAEWDRIESQGKGFYKVKSGDAYAMYDSAGQCVSGGLHNDVRLDDEFIVGYDSDTFTYYAKTGNQIYTGGQQKHSTSDGYLNINDNGTNYVYDSNGNNIRTVELADAKICGPYCLESLTKLYNFIDDRDVAGAGELSMMNVTYEGEGVYFIRSWFSIAGAVDVDDDLRLENLIANYVLGEYDTHTGVHNGNLLMKVSNNNYVLVNESGDNLLPDYEFNDAGDKICGEYTDVTIGDLYGVIDVYNGVLLAPVQYKFVRQNDEWLYGANDTEAFFINKESRIITAFDTPCALSEGVLSEILSRGYSVIDGGKEVIFSNGKIISSNGADVIQGELAGIKDGGRIVYFDRNGEKVLDSEDELVFTNGYAMATDDSGNTVVFNDRGELCWYGEDDYSAVFWSADGKLFVARNYGLRQYDLTEHPLRLQKDWKEN